MYESIDSEAWQPEDFTDEVHQVFVEDDPWSDIPESQFDESQNADEVVVMMSASESTPVQPSLPLYDNDDAQMSEKRINEHEATEGEYDFDLGDDDDLVGYDAIHEEIDTQSIWDEPEPVAEYDDDLSESLNIVDYELADVTRRLKIDELIVSVAPADDAQRTRMAEILEGISPSRIGRWLDWLHVKSWTGHSLLLFLEFRINHWEETPEWWEATYWSKEWRDWIPYSEPTFYALSRDATYDLVQARLDCRAEDIIDDDWLEDWDYYMLWKFGFWSFASFAVFRAQLEPGKDWRPYTSQYSDFDTRLEIHHMYRAGHRGRFEETLASLGGNYRIWDDLVPFHNLRNSKEWFAIQDWYSDDEWHDGLGWSHGSFEDMLSEAHTHRDMTSPYTELPYRSPDES